MDPVATSSEDGEKQHAVTYLRQVTTAKTKPFSDHAVTEVHKNTNSTLKEETSFSEGLEQNMY